MTFIIEATKDDHHTVDIRSTAIVAVILARKLAADGYEVSIRSPTGRSVFCRSVQPFADEQKLEFGGASGRRLRAATRSRSEAGMPAAVLAEIGRSTLPAGIGRRAIVIGECAGPRSGPVIVAEADRVGQPIGVKGGPRLRQAGCGGQRGQDCSGIEELQAGHLE